MKNWKDLKAVLKASYIILLCLSYSSLFAKQDVLRIAISDDYPPVHFGIDNQKSSISTDSIKEIFKNHKNLEIIFVSLPWERAQLYTKEGKVDAIITVPTKKRLEYTNQTTHPIIKQRFEVFKHKSIKLSPDDITEIRNKHFQKYKVCEYFSSGWAKQNLKKNTDIIYSQTMLSKIKMLNSARCDLIIDSEISSNYIIKKNGYKDIESTKIYYEGTDFFFLLSKSYKDQTILKYIDQELVKPATMNKLNLIQNNWISWNSSVD